MAMLLLCRVSASKPAVRWSYGSAWWTSFAGTNVPRMGWFRGAATKPPRNRTCTAELQEKAAQNDCARALPTRSTCGGGIGFASQSRHNTGKPREPMRHVEGKGGGRTMLKFLALAVAAICAMPAAAQESPDRFPSRFVTIVAPFPPGGPSDTTARLL